MASFANLYFSMCDHYIMLQFNAKIYPRLKIRLAERFACRIGDDNTTSGQHRIGERASLLGLVLWRNCANTVVDICISRRRYVAVCADHPATEFENLRSAVHE